MGLDSYTICNLNEGVSPMARQQIANLSDPCRWGLRVRVPLLPPENIRNVFPGIPAFCAVESSLLRHGGEQNIVVETHRGGGDSVPPGQ